MIDNDVLSEDDLRNIEQDDLALLFLDAVEQHDGRATTREIREAHNLSPDEAHYRYDKLSDLGLITVKYDNSLTPKGKSAMKIAEFTELGEAYVADELEEEDIEREATTEELAEEAHEQTKENRDEIESMYGWAADTDARINALTTVFDALGLDEETWEKVVMLHNPNKELDADEEQLKEFIRDQMSPSVEDADDEQHKGNGSPWNTATALA